MMFRDLLLLNETAIKRRQKSRWRPAWIVTMQNSLHCLQAFFEV
jgi:hypothetical protein